MCPSKGMWAPEAGVLVVGGVGLMPQGQLLKGFSGQAPVSCQELKLEQSFEVHGNLRGPRKS